MNLGDRMKLYEKQFDNKLLPLLPLMARLDGQCFHSFTKGLEKPFDINLSNLMIATAEFLLLKNHALVAYTQSDEITLLFYKEENIDGYFANRILKLASILASQASAFFNVNLPKYLPNKIDLFPVFDCRVWNVPNKIEATNTFLWRELDATRNSITAAAQAVYNHKELHGKSSADKHEMLWQKGINWNDYPDFFKKGVYLRKRIVPVRMELPPLIKIINRVDVIFDDAKPEIDNEPSNSAETNFA